MTVSRFVSLGLAVGAALLATATASTVTSTPAWSAGASQPVARGPSGLPLPRFVSLKASRVNLRIGPGRSYAVDWLYLRSGLPMEIIQEYDNWRRVRDSEGVEGWISGSLLSGRRTGIAAPWQRGKAAEIALRKEPYDGARTVALVEPGAVGEIRACNGDWCRMDFDGHTGWVRQQQVWGAYPGETIED